jgi:hypothetical protein
MYTKDYKNVELLEEIDKLYFETFGEPFDGCTCGSPTQKKLTKISKKLCQKSKT